MVRKGRLQPGRMFLVDTEHGRIVDDEEIKAELAAQHPYDEWLHAGRMLPRRPAARASTSCTRTASVTRRQQAFGYTEEELRLLVAPMAEAGAEPIGSMGTDTPVAVLSSAAAAAVRLLHPAVRAGDQPAAGRDPGGAGHLPGHRASGRSSNLLEATPAHCRQLVLPFPVIDNDDLAKIVHINADGDLPGYATVTVQGLYRVDGGGEALAAPAGGDLRRGLGGDRRPAPGSSCCPTADSTAELAPIPSLLLTSAVHHHLIREKTRTQVGLLVEAGDVREVHHVALLIGYGAAAVNPYLAMESVEDLVRSRRAHRDHPGEGGREPDQGARQGRAEGDEQDGHLHGGLLPRRPGVRGASAWARSWSTGTSPGPPPSSAGSAWT